MVFSFFFFFFVLFFSFVFLFVFGFPSERVVYLGDETEEGQWSHQLHGVEKPGVADFDAEEKEEGEGEREGEGEGEEERAQKTRSCADEDL
jgi:hypothetical protein